MVTTPPQGKRCSGFNMLGCADDSPAETNDITRKLLHIPLLPTHHLDRLCDSLPTLVSAEREKLHLPALPTNCTPAMVLGSRNLPHTIVLGTTCVAAFLGRFAFGDGEVVNSEEIYRVSKGLGEEERRKEVLVANGVIGWLEQRFGRLAAVY